MKTLEEINKARSILCDRISNEGHQLTRVQFTLLQGMLVALVWAADGENKDTVERILNMEIFK